MPASGGDRRAAPPPPRHHVCAIDTFNSADDYIAAIQQLSAIVRDVRVERVLSEDDDVCVLYDLVTATPAGTAPVAERYRVRGDRIAAIRAYFDARPFVPR